MNETHEHCWHWNHMSRASLASMVVDTDEEPINGYTCCWCGEEQWRAANLRDHGPYHPYAPIVRPQRPGGESA